MKVEINTDTKTVKLLDSTTSLRELINIVDAFCVDDELDQWKIELNSTVTNHHPLANTSPSFRMGYSNAVTTVPSVTNATITDQGNITLDNGVIMRVRTSSTPRFNRDNTPG